MTTKAIKLTLPSGTTVTTRSARLYVVVADYFARGAEEVLDTESTPWFNGRMAAATTLTPTQEVTVNVTITPATATADNRGTLCVGSILDGCASPMWDGKIVADLSATAYYLVESVDDAVAYLVDDVDCGGWVSFDAVHGRPGFVAPLVEFGG